jgi:hypothetical protein
VEVLLAVTGDLERMIGHLSEHPDPLEEISQSDLLPVIGFTYLIITMSFCKSVS